MRELKFKIWDRQANRWAENDCSLHCCSNWQIDPFTGKLTDFVSALDSDEVTRYNADPAPDYYWKDGQIVNEPRYVLVQFTGIKDKNGKEIYEGDILIFRPAYDESLGGQFGNAIFSVSFKDASFRFGDELADQEGANYYEVIGNIFENPELLEV